MVVMMCLLLMCDDVCSGSNRLSVGGRAAEAWRSIPTDVAEEACQAISKPTGVLQQVSRRSGRQGQGSRGRYSLLLCLIVNIQAVGIGF